MVSQSRLKQCVECVFFEDCFTTMFHLAVDLTEASVPPDLDNRPPTSIWPCAADSIKPHVRPATLPVLFSMCSLIGLYLALIEFHCGALFVTSGGLLS